MLRPLQGHQGGCVQRNSVTASSVEGMHVQSLNALAFCIYIIFW